MMSLGLRFLWVIRKVWSGTVVFQYVGSRTEFSERHSMQHAYTPRVEGESVMQTGVV